MKNYGLVAIAAFLMFCLSSCTKERNDGSKFIGTWYGKSSCDSSPATRLIFLTGDDNNIITHVSSVGVDACRKPIIIEISADGDQLNAPTQHFTDTCGNKYTIFGRGYLNGSTLTYTETVAGATVTTCTFVGRK